ncbi:MAG: ABC transporter ATP-binding protein [Lentisphaerae bacterium]|nr:ABC transporter ATP-binding protein [Lentisphaerota bacterium]
MTPRTTRAAPSHDIAPDTVLSVRSVSKKFCRNLRRSMLYGVRDLAFNLMGSRQDTMRLRREEFWALDDVSFDLRRGEFLGIVGSNGSGKSTLLRIIAGIFPPDGGEVCLRGRVGALIALGTGFHPHMTGRENIFLNGAILGMDRDYIRSRFDNIVQFADIGDFLDAPVATYSSGMRVRLGFAVAVHMAPDLMLVDEVLSVGDASFRERCYNHMLGYKNNGGTVVFISHNTVAVEQVCDRALWLEGGRLVDSGPPARLIEAYELKMLARSRMMPQEGPAAGPTTGAAERIQIERAECLADDGSPRQTFDYNECLRFRVHYRVLQPSVAPSFYLTIKRSAGEELLSSMATRWQGIDLDPLPSQGVVECRLPAPRLAPGSYVLMVGVQGAITDAIGVKWYTPLRERSTFVVGPGNLRGSLPNLPATHIIRGLPPMVQPHRWFVDGKPAVTVPLSE